MLLSRWEEGEFICLFVCLGRRFEGGIFWSGFCGINSARLGLDDGLCVWFGLGGFFFFFFNKGSLDVALGS